MYLKLFGGWLEVEERVKCSPVGYNCSSESEWNVVNLTQAIQQAEEGLRELEGGISELKRRGDKLQVEQPALQELSKLQVAFPVMPLGLSRPA